MTAGIAAFIAAVGGTSLVCYWLTNRPETRSARRKGASGDSADSGGSFTVGYGGDGWNVFSWFSGNDASSPGSDNASDSAGASGDWGGSDSGGGGDGGGGDGSGGGD